jgi:hypothetical protein
MTVAAWSFHKLHFNLRDHRERIVNKRMAMVVEAGDGQDKPFFP